MLIDDGFAQLPTIAAASVPSPPVGSVRLFFDSANANRLSQKDSAGAVIDLAASAGGGGISNTLTQIAQPATPAAASITEYSANDTGAPNLSVVDSNGTVSAYPLGLLENKLNMLTANPGTATFSVIGSTITATGTGTVAAFTPGSRYGRTNRIESLVTVAAATAVAGIRNSIAGYTCGGEAAGAGGFSTDMVAGPATGVTTATSRFFMGMTGGIAAPTDVEPSTVVNTIGLGYDAADANLQLMVRGAATGAKIDLGASFPVPTTDRTKLYRLQLYSPPGTTQTVNYKVADLITGAVTSGTVSTNLPATSVVLGNRVWSSVGGTSSVIGTTLSYWATRCAGY
jgi:hypothetical protein